MRKVLVAALAAGLLAGSVGAGRAVTLFASVDNRPGDTARHYIYTNNGLPGLLGQGVFDVSPNPMPVSFTWFIPGSPFTTAVNGLMTFHSVNDGVYNTVTKMQPQKAFSFEIKVDQPNLADPYHAENGKVLLKGVASGADLTRTSALNASFDTDNVDFDLIMVSQYFVFSGDEAATWSYSSRLHDMGPNASNGILASNSFGGNGNFAADQFRPVPEPGALSLLVGAGIAGSLLRLRRKRA